MPPLNIHSAHVKWKALSWHKKKFWAAFRRLKPYCRSKLWLWNKKNWAFLDSVWTNYSADTLHSFWIRKGICSMCHIRNMHVTIHQGSKSSGFSCLEKSPLKWKHIQYALIQMIPHGPVALTLGTLPRCGRRFSFDFCSNVNVQQDSGGFFSIDARPLNFQLKSFFESESSKSICPSLTRVATLQPPPWSIFYTSATDALVIQLLYQFWMYQYWPLP